MGEAGLDPTFLLSTEDFGTPPPSVPELYNSSPSSSARLSLSPITTPQHRRGESIEAEEPLTPLSIEFTEVLRQKLNEVTGLLGLQGGKASVLLAGMERYAKNFKEGTEF
ncbi:hypothetical protein LTR86_010155 [Recurvomyces mirabilis]|nr:hypothetical protein LTR86_010155 [Recurvomyces mirabilis]